jgi:hypothetical protein
MQTIVGYVPGSELPAARRRAEGVDDDWTGMRRANVYLPDGIYKFERRRRHERQPVQRSIRGGRAASWNELPDAAVRREPARVVPIVPLRNRPRSSRGTSRSSRHLPHPEPDQRVPLPARPRRLLRRAQAALGGRPEDHGRRATGKPVEPFDVAVDKLWVNAGENRTRSSASLAATDLTATSRRSSRRCSTSPSSRGRRALPDPGGPVAVR